MQPLYIVHALAFFDPATRFGGPIAPSPVGRCFRYLTFDGFGRYAALAKRTVARNIAAAKAA